MTIRAAPATLALQPTAQASLVEHQDAVRSWMVTVRKVGFAALGAQFVVLVIWSQIRVERFALTWDFSNYFQSWWLLAHGNLNPFSTVHGFPFWAHHGEFLMWPLALMGAIWPNPVTLLWLQSAGIVGAEAVAYSWICDLAVAASDAPTRARSSPAQKAASRWSPFYPSPTSVPRTSPASPTPTVAVRPLWPVLLALTGLVLLVADPWLYWSVSFDFHFQLVGLVFLLLAARALLRTPRSKFLWLWVAVTLLSGDVATTYLAAVGAGAAFARRASRRDGAIVACAAVAWVLFLNAIHANRGSELSLGYGYLAAGAGAAAPAQIDVIQIARGVAQHPREVLDVVWSRRLDLYAAMAPGGFLGSFSPWVWVTVVVVLLENSLNHYLLYLTPGFQDVLVYVLVPIGTIDVLVRLGRRLPRLAICLCTLVAVNVIAWGAVWLPKLSTQWLRVSPGAASVLASVQRQIPSSDEVVAWQGISGTLSGRRWFYPVQGPATFPVHTSTVWIVVAPAQGIELASVVDADAFIDELAGPLHAHMVADRDGIWAFRWNPSRGEHSLVVPSDPTVIGAWSSVGTAGRPDIAGPTADWRAVSNAKRGYVVAEDYWLEPPGEYRVTAALSTAVAVNVEVWNATGDVMLARRVVPPTYGERSVTLDVDARHQYPPSVYRGAGPFSIDPLLPTPDDRLEIRIWTPGGAAVSVTSLEMKRADS